MAIPNKMAKHKHFEGCLTVSGLYKGKDDTFIFHIEIVT